MSKRNHKAIFERECKPDNFGTAKSTWEEVAREWVSLEPLTGRELLLAQQVQAQTTHKVSCNYGTTMAQIDAAYRFKVAKPSVVDENDPDNDCNFRIFQIESILNVGERNRELQMMVKEAV